MMSLKSVLVLSLLICQASCKTFYTAVPLNEKHPLILGAPPPPAPPKQAFPLCSSQLSILQILLHSKHHHYMPSAPKHSPYNLLIHNRPCFHDAPPASHKNHAVLLHVFLSKCPPIPCYCAPPPFPGLDGGGGIWEIHLDKGKAVVFCSFFCKTIVLRNTWLHKSSLV